MRPRSLHLEEKEYKKEKKHLEQKADKSSEEHKADKSSEEHKAVVLDKTPASSQATGAQAQPKKKQTAVTQKASSPSSTAKVTAAMWDVLLSSNPSLKINSFQALHTLVKQDNLGEQLFHIDVGNGRSLVESLDMPTLKLLMSFLKKEEFARKITLKQLCQARSWSQPYVNSSPMFWLALTDTGVAQLSHLFTMNPEWTSTTLFHEAFYAPLPKGAQACENTTPLYWLCASFSGPTILRRLISANPHLFATKAFMTALCHANTNDLGANKNTSGLYFLCSCSSGITILSTLFTENPQIINDNFIETLYLARPAAAGAYDNDCGLHVLCSSPEGQALLSKLIAANPQWINEDFVIALCRACTRAVENMANAAGLYWLCSTPDGQILLGKLLSTNLHLFATEAFMSALCRPCHTNSTGLSALCATSEGQILLSELIIENSHLVNTHFIIELCLTRSVRRKDAEPKNTTGLYELCSTSAGLTLLSLLIDIHPDIGLNEDFVGALTATAKEHEDKSALTVLQSSSEGQALVAKIVKNNRYLFPKSALADKESTSQEGAATVEETMSHRFFEAPPTAAESKIAAPVLS
jgi:hypothetical protein